MFFFSTKWESMKQCVEPESTKALKIMVFGRSEVVTGKNRALGSNGAAALRRTSSIARSMSSQPEVRAVSKRLLSIFFASSAGLLSDDVTCAALPLAFAALDQSFAVCPTPPQKRHKLLANRRDRSAGVSFPSRPSFSPKSVFFLSRFWDSDPLLLKLGFLFLFLLFLLLLLLLLLF